MIETLPAGSPGWWFSRLAAKMSERNGELEILQSYMDGNAPLPEPASARVRRTYLALQKKGRTNFGERIVQAPVSRMTVAGFRVGDERALSKDCSLIWSYNDLDATASDVHFDMIGLRHGYVVVGPPGGDGIPVITRENPLLMIAEPDPLRPTRMRAALKLFRDEFSGLDTAYLYLPGAVYVAVRNNANSSQPLSTDISGYEWQPGPMRWPKGFEDVVPVVRFDNPRLKGEFETHIDTIDRINSTILHRLAITEMQAYRQRAVKGSDKIKQIEVEDDGETPKLDEDGKTIPIDLSEEFASGPDALWLMPSDVEIWESATTDFTPILSAAKDDIRLLAMETETPISMLWPEGANQSAEGARLAERGFIFKVEDRQKKASFGWNRVMELALDFSGRAVSVLDLETLWAPAERLSLSERADAASKLVAAQVPWRTIMTDVMQFSPEKVEEMERERLADALSASLAQSGS